MTRRKRPEPAGQATEPKGATLLFEVGGVPVYIADGVDFIEFLRNFTRGPKTHETQKNRLTKKRDLATAGRIDGLETSRY